GQQGDGLAVERRARGIVECGGAAIDAEGGRDEAVAEEAALDVDERQDTANRAPFLGIEVVRRVAEAALDHPPPAGAVEEGGIRAALDEGVPCGGAVVAQRAQDERGRSVRHRQPGSSASSTRSMRSQEKARR